MSPHTLDEILSRARGRIDRLEPAAALAELRSGAILVDTRSSDSRRRNGVVPGALHVPRSVLEWRFDPDGENRSPHAPEPGARVVVLCDLGYSSVLAAASLVDLGYAAADVVGGFDAWARDGLPISPGPADADDVIPGLRPPDS